MSIKEIKQKLSILTVLSHYNLESNRNNMLRCPFHEDKEASMRVYPETNTVYCFAGSCKVSNLDVVDFVMEMDGGTKHEAIKKQPSKHPSTRSRNYPRITSCAMSVLARTRVHTQCTEFK